MRCRAGRFSVIPWAARSRIAARSRLLGVLESNPRTANHRNLCNADCIMCPNGIMERPVARMDMDLFKKIVDELAASNMPFIKFVFAGIGEPTIDPRLHEKIRYLKEKMPKIPVQLPVGRVKSFNDRTQKGCRPLRVARLEYERNSGYLG